MGKGNRTRNERAETVLTDKNVGKKNIGKKKASKGMPTWVGTLIVVAVLVLLIAVVAISVLNSRGTFKRMRIIAESQNFEVTVPMMSYLVYTEYQNRVAMYEEYSEQYGTSIAIGGGEGGKALDTSSPLREQVYSSVTGPDGQLVTTTWFDYFAGVAESDVRQILACCEEAKAANFALTDEELEEIEKELDALEQYATLYGYSTNGYLSLMYGEGVILKDVRAMMKLTELATKWSNHKAEEFLAGVTDGRIDEYYNNNKSTYDVYCDYIGYTFTATFAPVDTGDDAATKNEEAAAKYKAEQEKYAARVEELIKCVSAIDFNQKLYNYILEDEMAAMAEKKETTVDALTEEQIAECSAAAEKALLKAAVENAADGDGDDDLDEWLFESKKENDVKTYLRKNGDTKKLEDVVSAIKGEETEKKEESDGQPEAQTEGSEGSEGAEGSEGSEEKPVEYQKATSTYSAYFFVTGIHRNDDLVRSVGHILFKSTTYDGKTSTSAFTGKIKELADKVLARDGKLTAYAMAGELLDTLYAEGKITEATRENGSKYYKIDQSVFEEYGLEYTEDGNVFYDDVYEGQMVEEFEEWLFDSTRVEGEIGYPEPVKTTYGYHIMYYVGNENETWRSEIKKTLSGNDNTAYLKGIQETHPVTVNSDYYRYIAG